MQKVGQCQKRHALVMGHIGLDDHPALFGPTRGVTLRLPTEIHGLVIAVIAKQAKAFQPFQIPHGLAGRHLQCQQCCIGGDDQLFLQTTLQAEGRNAEGLILIGLLQIQIGKGGFGNAPRHMLPLSVSNLDRHGLPDRLVQKRVGIGTLEQERHQILEHGSGPAEQHPLPADGPVRSVQGEPVLQRDIAPGDGDETSQPGLAGQQIIAGSVQTVGGDVVADGEQLALGVVEKPHIHACRQRADVGNQSLSRTQGLSRQPLRGGKGRKKAVEPGRKGCAGLRSLLPNGL